MLRRHAVIMTCVGVVRAAGIRLGMAGTMLQHTVGRRIMPCRTAGDQVIALGSVELHHTVRVIMPCRNAAGHVAHHTTQPRITGGTRAIITLVRECSVLKRAGPKLVLLRAAAISGQKLVDQPRADHNNAVQPWAVPAMTAGPKLAATMIVRPHAPTSADPKGTADRSLA
jgi:hypothetical protein